MTSDGPLMDLSLPRAPFWALVVTNLTVVIGVTVSASLGWAAAPQTICSSAADRQIINDPTSYLPLSELSNLIAGDKVVLIGEQHRTHFAFRKPLLKMIGETRAGRVCIFHELNRDSDIQEHLVRVQKPGYELVAQFLKLPHEVARERGWQEFTIDTKSPEDDVSVAEINRRDQAMAERIAQLMASNCDSALMFIGKAHVLSEKANRVNLKVQLDRAKISNVVINLQDPNDERMIELWGLDYAKTAVAWNGVCKKGQSLPRPKHPVIFLNQKLPAERLVYPRVKELSQWRSFDFTILASDPDLE